MTFAFLASRLAHARVDIEHDYAPAKFEGPDHGWATVDGKPTPFHIFTNAERLCVRRLTGYAFVQSAAAMPTRQKIEMRSIARSRLRAMNQPLPPMIWPQ